MSTILWQYERKVSSEKLTLMLFTGLFSLCNCSDCLANPSIDLTSYYSFRFGHSIYHCYFRPEYNTKEFFNQSFYKGCPKSNGEIVVGGFEEVFSNLDDFDKEIVIFNINLFS